MEGNWNIIFYNLNSTNLLAALDKFFNIYQKYSIPDYTANSGCKFWVKRKVKRAKLWNLLEAVALFFSHDLAPSCFPALYMAHAAASTYDCSLQESLFIKRSKRHKMYIFYMCFCRPFSVPVLCLPYVFECLTVHLLRNIATTIAT